MSPEFCEYLAYQALVKWDRYYELPEPEEAAQLKREWVLGNDTVAEFWEDVKGSIEPTSCRTSTCPCATTNGWTRSTRHADADEPQGVHDPNRRARVRRRRMDAEQGRERVRPQDELREVVPRLAGLSQGRRFWRCGRMGPLHGQASRDFRTAVLDYCTAHDTTPADLGADYAAVREQLGLAADTEDND